MHNFCHTSKHILFSQAVGGFLLVVTSSGKVVYITEAIEQFFGHSQVIMLAIKAIHTGSDEDCYLQWWEKLIIRIYLGIILYRLLNLLFHPLQEYNESIAMWPGCKIVIKNDEFFEMDSSFYFIIICTGGSSGSQRL